MILIVVILAVVALVALQLINTAKEASKKVGEGASGIINASENVGGAAGKVGEFCVRDSDCESSLECVNNRCS